MLPRTHWDQLSDHVRNAIQDRTGPVLDAETATEGLNSALAAILQTTSGSVFVKGLRTDHPGVVTQRREALINTYVRTVAPRLLWQVEVDGWSLLAFDYIEGRHADYSPGSPDLPKVIDAMAALGDIVCPDVPIKQAEQRWSDYTDDASAQEFFRGNSLLHTDFNPLNVLISDEATYLIDWAWPTRGAAWIDPACFLLRLMAAGHDAAEAEYWAAQTAAWRDAPSDGIAMFAEASSRMWAEIAANEPLPWKQRMASVAQAWVDYRV
jgi:hypothetical protein